MSGERCIIIIQGVTAAMEEAFRPLEGIAHCLGDSYKDFLEVKGLLLAQAERMQQYAIAHPCE